VTAYLLSLRKSSESQGETRSQAIARVEAAITLHVKPGSSIPSRTSAIGEFK
jgi:hypothetical protein